MIRRQGHVALPEASRHLQRLCYHFSRKITVSYNEQRGLAQFPWGQCLLQAQDGLLSFDCEAADEGNLLRVQFAIDSHIELFSRKSPVNVEWQAIEPLP